MSNLWTLQKTIEKEIQVRGPRALELIRKYAKIAGRSSSKIRCLISEWYRRLGRFNDAYSVLDLQSAQSRQDRSVLIQAARMLNLMGAGSLANQILDAILKANLGKRLNDSSTTLDETRVLANILLSQYRFQDASLLYQEYFRRSATEAYPSLYVHRLTRVNYSDTLSGIGLYKEALAEPPYVRKDVAPKMLRWRGEKDAHHEIFRRVQAGSSSKGITAG